MKNEKHRHRLMKALLMVCFIFIVNTPLEAREPAIPDSNQVILKSGVWNPTPQQTFKALIAIRAFLLRQNQAEWGVAYILKYFDSYRVQFVGENHEGKKKIFCNFFPIASGAGEDNFPDWRKMQISVDDGGASYWQILYDPVTGECTQFSVNGVA